MTRLVSLLFAMTLIAACNGSDGDTFSSSRLPVAPTPPATVLPSIASLAGRYTLNIEFPTACAATFETSKPRQYQATLDTTSYPYLAVTIAGGGYTQTAVAGDMSPTYDGQVMLRYNNFDVGGCDGEPEPLPGGSTLMVCGGGPGVRENSTIVVQMTTEVFIINDRERRKVCDGPSRFTFTRVTP